MPDFKPTFPADLALPTLTNLGVSVKGEGASTTTIPFIAKTWFTHFAAAIADADIPGLISLLLPGQNVYWRDILSLTWDFRTFYGEGKIAAFLDDRLHGSGMRNCELQEEWVKLERPYEDLLWIQGLFKFKTSIGTGTGVFRLVPTPTSADTSALDQCIWKAHTIFTTLESLSDYPELTGQHRLSNPNHGHWPLDRQKELDCRPEDGEEPRVIVIGAGQSGLEISARLKYLGVKTLVVEKQARVGDQWRGRYEALCLHDPVWYDHMPYIPFPPTWPVFTPAPKLADWLEGYARSLELNVWTSSNVTSISQDPTSKVWTVKIQRGNGTLSEERTFKVKHLIFALGWGGGTPSMPTYPGMDKFTGQILHSSQFGSARDYVGKKVVVVGACTSGHDISSDCYNHGIDVTMYQRSQTYVMSTKNGFKILLSDLYSENAPPTEVADIINASYPLHLMHLMHQRKTRDLAEADKDLLDGLRRRGFRLGWGNEGSGFLLLAWTKGGGYYLDVGTSQLIADGKIKLKNDSPISSFSTTGLTFENGSTLDADVVIFATGYTNVRQPIEKLCGDSVATRLKTIWGLNDEGEIRSAWRDTGVEGLYIMMGNLALCRFHSKHLALQIKAMEEGVFTERYSK